MSNSSVIWLLDDREIRRAAISGFLTAWAYQSSIEIRAVDVVESIPRGSLDVESTAPQMCILVVGGTSLADPDLSSYAQMLVEILAGRPLAILSDIDSAQEVTLAIEHMIDGLITTKMPTSVVFAALNFILLGGTYFERSSLMSICKKQTSIAAKADAPAESWSALSGAAARKMAMSALHDGPPAPQMDQPDGAFAGGLASQPTLTQRQNEIVEMLKLGRSNKEIARMLDISDATVKIFVRQVMKKYGAINRTQVALLASDAMSHVDIINLRHIAAPPPLRPEP